jgi:uncharacterized membrane protein
MSQVPPSTAAPAPDVTDNDKLMALLSYLLTPLVPAIVLLSADMKARPYQRYHAVQALGLIVAEAVIAVVLCILVTICAAVSLGIGGLLYCLFFLLYIPQIYYAFVAYTKPTYFEIPMLTQFMVQQHWLTRP